MGVKRKGLADQVGKRKYKKGSDSPEKTSNPFEFKYNKQKQDVIGRKSAKGQVGLPGASRKKAEELRREKLLPEFRRFGKVNKIKDRRVGEADPSLSKEERHARRFALEREKRFKKTSAYHLDDDEDLTHYGQSLAEIETFERPQLDEEDETRGMDSDFVSSVHFGGGEAQGENSGERRSRKDIIQEMIAKSKQIRFEKYQQKEENVTRTEDLDETWKELVKTTNLGSLLSTSGQKKEAAPEPETGKSYDMLVNEMKFETRRVKAVDKLKTPEEIAKEEKEKLEKLEVERIARMEGLPSPDEAKKKVHVSADDDLDGNLRFGPRKRLGGDFVVAYDKDGKLINKAEKSPKETEENSESEEEEDEEDSDYEEELFPLEEVEPTKAAKQAELPFVFKMPKSFTDFVNLFNQYPWKDHGTIIERLIKTYHPSLREGNKDKLGGLFLHVLRFCDFSALKGPMADFGPRLDILCGALYKLANICPDQALRYVQALIRSHRKQMFGKQKRKHPDLNFFVLLKVVQALYPVSDLRHPVATAVIRLACRVLAKSLNRNPTDIAKGLMVAGALLPYFRDSKRYCPELVAFLLGVLHLSIKNESWERPPNTSFPVSEPHRWMLLIDQPITCAAISVFSVYRGSSKVPEDQLKAACIRSCCGLVGQLTELYQNLASYREIMEMFLRKLKRLPSDNYDENMKTEVVDLIQLVETSIESQRKRFLGGAVQKNVEFEFLEPKFDPDFDPDRHNAHGGAKKGPKAEKQRLLKGYKRELKGTIRELRKDSQFLARETLREEAEKDQQRKEKTKKLMQSLMGQESEYKKYQREKEKEKQKARR